jgi:uncharacterized membrane protein HdeD (DUF308 family)
MSGTFVEGPTSALEGLDSIRRSRGWFIALGAALMLLGFLAIAVPFAATLVSTIFLGWLLIIGGVAHAVHAARSQTWRGFPWEVLSAVLHVVAGVLVVLFPLAGTLTLTLVLAGLFTVEGVLRIVRALQHRGMERWGFLLFDGIVTLALGVLIWTQWPGAAVWVIGLLVGVELFLGGVSMLALAASAQRLTRSTTR